MLAWMLAHQGGWDELLLVLGPVAVFAALLWVANRRAGRLGPAAGADIDAPGDSSPRQDGARDDAATGDER